MSHDDDEIVGLLEALQKLPAHLRAAARHQFRRAFFEDDNADFSGPYTIHYPSSANGKWRTARLVIIRCETFVFDLFFIGVGRRKFIPVVGRAYPAPPDFMVAIN